MSTKLKIRRQRSCVYTIMLLAAAQPLYFHNLITASSQHSLFIFCHTFSSMYIIFSTNNRSFLPACFPCLWNQLPAYLRQPRTNRSNFDSPSVSGTSCIGSIDSALSSSITLTFIPSKKPSFSANPSHRSFSSSSGLTPWISLTVYRYF